MVGVRLSKFKIHTWPSNFQLSSSDPGMSRASCASLILLQSDKILTGNVSRELANFQFHDKKRCSKTYTSYCSFFYFWNVIFKCKFSSETKNERPKKHQLLQVLLFKLLNMLKLKIDKSVKNKSPVAPRISLYS
jgi:hypothetical protein